MMRGSLQIFKNLFAVAVPAITNSNVSDSELTLPTKSQLEITFREGDFRKSE